MLWVLNAGTVELGVVEGFGKGKTMGEFVPRVFCPGFLRGLDFIGNFAFGGLSKPRYARFEGLALDQRLQDTDNEPWCGVQIIDLTNNSCADWFQIDGAIAELYDIALILGAACPKSVSPTSPEVAQLITYAKPSGDPAETQLVGPGSFGRLILNLLAVQSICRFTGHARGTLGPAERHRCVHFRCIGRLGLRLRPSLLSKVIHIAFDQRSTHHAQYKVSLAATEANLPHAPSRYRTAYFV